MATLSDSMISRMLEDMGLPVIIIPESVLKKKKKKKRVSLEEANKESFKRGLGERVSKQVPSGLPGGFLQISPS